MDGSTDYVYDEGQDREFEARFGVSPKQLQEQGIDPATYVLDQIARRGRDISPSRPLAGAPSSVLAVAYTGWGMRGYYAIFVGLGFLALSKLAPVHWVGLIGATIAGLVAAYMVVMMQIYRRRYVRACRAEGVQPHWRRR